MKTGDYLHFPKVSKLMRTVQVSFQSSGGGMSTIGWLAECDFSCALLIAAVKLASGKHGQPGAKS